MADSHEMPKASVVRLMFGGDVMLGRLVREHVRLFGPDYPLEDVATLLKGADASIVNLECALTDHEHEWGGARKAFYFRGAPSSAAALARAGVTAVTLANNHVLDFEVEGLRETLRLLRAQGIGFAGAGADLDEARRAALVERHGIKFGLVAYCDHQADFEAADQRPGIAFLDVRNLEDAIGRVREDLVHLRAQGVTWPILSLHWGPNTVETPSRAFQAFAHAAVDEGVGVVYGHSAHSFQGVEIYRGRPILYSAGDFVDDYMVDSGLRNDLGLLFELEVDAQALRGLRFHPLRIQRCKAVPADGPEFEFIAARAQRLCEAFGTRVKRADNHLVVGL